MKMVIIREDVFKEREREKKKHEEKEKYEKSKRRRVQGITIAINVLEKSERLFFSFRRERY